MLIRTDHTHVFNLLPLNAETIKITPRDSRERVIGLNSRDKPLTLLACTGYTRSHQWQLAMCAELIIAGHIEFGQFSKDAARLGTTLLCST